MTDFEAMDFFRGDELVADPYPYFDALREQCPVRREPHHGVMMVTGYDEAVEVYHDAGTFSSCISVTGPFPGFPVPLEGDDVQRPDRAAPATSCRSATSCRRWTRPMHTDHRALLMRLITPKRLKENEDVMWRLADRQLDEFLRRRRGRVHRRLRRPVHPARHRRPARRARGRTGRSSPSTSRAGRRTAPAIGGTGQAMAHNPLEFLYDRFATYVEDRRREPRDDVLTGLATATFPDGSVPEVGDVVRVAANLFSAGQETTVRLLSTALKIIAERPDLQELLQQPSVIASRTSSRRRCASRARSRGTSGCRGSRPPWAVSRSRPGTTVMVLNGGREP